MSKIEVDTIAPQSGTTVTLGESGDTVNIPSGVTLTNSGTATGFGISWQSDIKTSAFTAVAGEGYWINTTSAAFTVTLPASASVGDTIEFTDYARTWGTNAVTLNTNGLNFQNASGLSPEYNTSGQSLRLVYSGATAGWIPTDDDSVTNKDVILAEYLVVAGGATGAGGNGGGGGAGGYLTNYGTSTITLTSGQVYTATVGAGGASVSGNPKVQGNSGSNSSLSGTGISTITALGGGGAGSAGPGPTTGLDGGSGGGGGELVGAGGSGTVGQGNDGAPGVGNVGGGGGGAGEAGNTDGTAYGGDGLSNSITGSATFYAGGGGGGGVSGGPGGDGGGTTGVGNPNSSASSPANTGGGSGGVNDQPTGNGGSGVVILRLPTAKYTGTTTGSPTVTTDGTDTVIKFTSSGSYTA
jgi:hypothetical protein